MKKLRHVFKGFIAAATASIALASMPSHALVINFYSGSDLYATMTTTPQTNFDLHFVGQNVAPGGFINDLFLDGPNGTFANLPGTGGTATGTYALNGYNGGGGQGSIYDWLIDFSQANNANRITIGEHALFSITVTDPSAWSIEKVHINAFDANGNSIKIDGCVAGTPNCGGGNPPNEIPLPGTLLLLGSGLFGLSFARRRA